MSEWDEVDQFLLDDEEEEEEEEPRPQEHRITVRLTSPDDLGHDIMVEEALINAQVAPDDEKGREISRREMRKVASELAGPTPTVIERSLATQAAYCWVYLRVIEMYSLANVGRPADQTTDHVQRRVNAAHQRYLRTLRALAAVKRGVAPAASEDHSRDLVRDLLVAAANGYEGRAAPEPDDERWLHRPAHQNGEFR
jgi:hypothetical protein